MYQIKYSNHFVQSLSNQIDYWENQLLIAPEQIEDYIALVNRNIRILASFPYIYQDVKDVYHFPVPTYKIPIGKRYAIFYRVDEKNKTIMIGSLFSNKQMLIEF